MTPDAQGHPDPRHFPGRIPVSTALRVVLSHAGIKNPATGAPFSEAMIFGIDGGIGAGVFSFHYAKENFSSFFVAGRHRWQDDAHWTEGARTRLGVTAVIRESSGVKPGEKHLRELLQGGRPVIAWVDSTGLPHRAVPGAPSGGGYHLVTVYSLDDDSGTALIGDLAPTPITIPLPALAEARGRIKKFKNRVLALEPARGTPPLAPLVRASLQACVDGLTKGSMKNFTLEAFKGWAERLEGSKAADCWEKIFAPGPHFLIGLRSIIEYVEYAGTGGGLCRLIFSEFLGEAGRELADGGLVALSARYGELAGQWSELARAALPGEVPELARIRELVKRHYELLHSGGAGAPEEIAECRKALGDISAAVGRHFPLEGAASAALRRNLKERVLALYQGESEALKEVQAWL